MMRDSVPGAHEASCLANDTRTPMNDLDYRTKAVDQLAIFVPMVVERRFSF